MKTTLILGLLLFGTIGSQAQITPQMLVGEWRLDAIADKEISASEKQKRYIYTTDTLTFKSIKINTKGLYKIREDGTSHEWYIAEAPKPLLIVMEFIGTDTLKISDGTTASPAGYLVRISAEGINHYQNGLKAEKQKEFTLAFSEFMKAAALQNPEAMYKLGMHYFTGTATKLDEKEATKWIRAAANLGNAQAQAIVNSNSLRY